MRFLADESCDIVVVEALRQAGHNVTRVSDHGPGADDELVVALARSESRILSTEGKDVGLLAYAGGQATGGVVLVRFPGNVRSVLGPAVVDAVARFGDRMASAFVVVEPGRARLSRLPGSAV